MAVGAAIAGGAGSLAGTYLSWEGGEKQRKAMQSQAKKQRALQREQMTEEQKRYDAETVRQTELEARQYEAAMGDYETTTASLDAWKKNWAEMAEDPRGKHPGWPSFETAITQAAESQMSQVKDIYQRRGKAGSGEYLRAVQDIESGRQQSLQDALMGITREARGKMFEIDRAMPAKPVLGAAHMYQAPQSYGFTPDPIPAIGDFSGLGQSLAYAMSRMKEPDKQPTTSTLPKGSTWATPSTKQEYDTILGQQFDAPQQSQYQLLE